jgi:hypothetical protein
MPTLRAGAYDWPWGPAVAAVAVVPVAVVPVGSVCTIITHRRCLATQSIRRLGRSARRTNLNPTTPRASQCSTESGASSSAVGRPYALRFVPSGGMPSATRPDLTVLSARRLRSQRCSNINPVTKIIHRCDFRSGSLASVSPLRRNVCSSAHRGLMSDFVATAAR